MRDRPVNIAFFGWLTFSRISGGIEAVGERLAYGLMARGHQVCLAAIEERYPSPLGIDSMLLPRRDKICSETNREALLSFFRSHQVEVIVCHSAHSHRTAQLLRSVADSLAVPLIVELHTTPDYYLYRPEHLSVKESLSRAVRILRARKQWRYISRIADRVVLLAWDYIPIMTREAGSRIVEKLVAIPNPNMYDEPVEETDCHREKIVLYVGRLSEEKGIPSLIEIWRKVSPGHPDWRLVVLGDGPLREAIEEAQLPRCSLEGQRDPQPYYCRSEILMMTSHYEGLPLVVMEALQHGVVPIAFDSFASLRTLTDAGLCGISVPPYEVEEYMCQLSELMDNQALRNRLSERARTHSHTFDLQEILPQWELLFERVIREKKK